MSNCLRPLLIFGTRPEAIKMAPVVHECRRRGDVVQPIVCLTGQHREMLRQVTDYFGLEADLNLELMVPNQSLAGLTARCLEAIDAVLQQHRPDCVVAQGDTTSAMVASLAAFYRRVPFVHVEAGLRTDNLQAPWPEELNRRIAGITATVHCAPTQRSADNLLAEGVSPSCVHVTGNTVIDALQWATIRERAVSDKWQRHYAMLNGRSMVLITAHRRENFGPGFEQICAAISQLADRFPDVDFVYPVHLNPHVQDPVTRILQDRANVHLLEPLPYPAFVWLMDRCHVMLSDSGGVQEEAPSLGKPVVVMRDTTERIEVVQAGAVKLVGTSPERIVHSVAELLSDADAYRAMQISRNPYGDGRAAERIVDLMLRRTWHVTPQPLPEAVPSLADPVTENCPS